MPKITGMYHHEVVERIEAAYLADEYLEQVYEAAREKKRREFPSYPDCLAQSHKDDERPYRDLLLNCPTGVAIGECEAGQHRYGMEVVCNREWCIATPGCGGKDGKAHQRRKSLWMPRVRQMKTMGQWTITLPPELRDDYRTREALAGLGKKVKRLYQRLGYKRGLRRYHWFGEPENGPDGVTPVFHPHLNLLTESGFLPYSEISKVVHGVARILKCDVARVVVHYQYDKRPVRMLHMMKYILRPTFLDFRWDEEMAYEVIGLRHCLAWGKWKEAGEWLPPLWGVQSVEESLAEKAEVVQRGFCPEDGTEIKWTGFLGFQYIQNDERWLHLGAGYWQFSDAGGHHEYL